MTYLYQTRRTLLKHVLAPRRRPIRSYRASGGQPADSGKAKNGGTRPRRRKAGRPETMVDIFRRVISERVNVPINGVLFRMTLAEAIIRVNFDKGLKRSPGAVRAIMSFLDNAGMLAPTQDPSDEGPKIAVPGRLTEEEVDAMRLGHSQLSGSDNTEK
jgi:hypothetical protein